MKFLLQILRHPIRFAGILLFLAALEGMFGAPEGARETLIRIVHVTEFIVSAALVMLFIYVIVHLRWAW